MVYGQLILEQAELSDVDDDLVDQMFDVHGPRLLRPRGRAARQAGASEAQQEWARGAVREPVVDEDRFERVWQQVEDLSGAYAMNP